ncbi:MAG: Uncharacterized protein XD58_2083 [Thermotoga sp. 50_1627]|uniref:DUF5723 domain-containing protein n=1 Tax=Pseudothermotoga hypogea DSM 11164 = NBRC 106472 TaxID=1123384 RepID=A0A0X1KRF2_9THEM|nr:MULTISPECIES: hypothetical protein [Pseudothermotoga]KUK01942.1 MAG: Uncharacterized protein XD45_1950 [Thermotoga sp. 50_64]KUK23918.1 MAG: Uncharacterized protein XD58_2083 [Thermotoga sp. 50_1627]AJC73801.1 hypothetical protein AJ81_05885 [Pseudothermotoga hypogea DSM 11164 = NBRC 106472]MBC7122499.1 hypothetical protein [Pseudothermotoga sp.]MDI6862039.1 hypothetical protein [Pseudothermotoga sp.]
MRRTLSFLLTLLVLLAFSYQWESWPGFFKPMKNSAMGGTYVTTAEGIESLLLNPALFEAGGAVGLNLNMSDNVVTIAPKLFELLKDPSKITQLATDTEFLRAVQGVHSYGLDLYGGYGTNVVWANVGGLGAFQTEVFWNLSLTNLTQVELGAWASYFGMVGGSLKLTRDLKIGLSVGFGMAGTLIPATGTSYPATVNVLDENSLNAVVPDVSKLFSYIDTPFFVFNVGALYRWNDLSLGVAFHYNSKNVLNSAPSQVLSAGVSYDLKILKLAFEVEDVLNTQKTFYRKMNLGLESDFGFLKLYAGLHAGWLTGGLKLDVPFFNVAFSTYVVEFSPNAGLMGERKYTLSFSARF